MSKAETEGRELLWGVSNTTIATTPKGPRRQDTKTRRAKHVERRMGRSERKGLLTHRKGRRRK